MDKKAISLLQLNYLLKKKLKGDLAFRSGRILGSMCSRPSRLAIRVFCKYIEKNIGDTGLVRDTARLEEETIRLLGRWLGAEAAGGCFVTGGSEANILAIWTATKLKKPGANELLLPESAHFSFDKAADLLGLKIIRLPLDEQHRLDVSALEAAISPRTVAIVAVAGSTPLGAVDPIPRIAELACANGIYLHVDAAFGGYVLPFLPEAQNSAYSFDFSNPGVQSITIDPHKMGLAPIPSGGILYRNQTVARTVLFDITYLAGGNTSQYTLVGTRSGAAVIAIWALLKRQGFAGYARIVARCMRLTTFFTEQLTRIETFAPVIRPVINVIGITSSLIPVSTLAAILRERGWAISLFKTHIRICVMPHVKKKHLREFLQELQRIVSEYRQA